MRKAARPASLRCHPSGLFAMFPFRSIAAEQEPPLRYLEVGKRCLYERWAGKGVPPRQK